MKTEKEQNLISSRSTSSAYDSIPKRLSSLNKIYPIIKTLIEKYYLEKVIQRIIHLSASIQNDYKSIKNTSDLDAILIQLMQIETPQKLIQAMIDFPNFIKETDKIDKKKKKEVNEIKKISMASTQADENFIDLGSNNKKKQYYNANNAFDSDKENMIIDEEESKDKTESNNKENEVIIDINDNYEDKGNNNDEIVEINDSTNNSLKSSNYIEIIPKSKHSKKMKLKKPHKRYDSNRISYHCSVIEGYYFKYKCDRFNSNKKRTKIKFKCYNPKCKSWGTYDTSDKSFILRQEHWDGNDIFCCYRLMTDQDKKNHSYMVNNKVVEIQMYNDK